MSGALARAAATVAGAVFVAGGLAVRRLQDVVPAFRSRRPTVDEERLLHEVFGDALPLGGVRIVPELRGAGIFGVSRRAVTLANTIYLKGDRRSALLVHECVHVWQYRQRGPRYAAEAVVAQNVGHGYDWRGAVAAGTTRWLDLDIEGQAQFLQDLYDGGTGVEQGRPVTGRGAYFRAYDAGADRDFPGHRAIAEDALATLRGHRAG